MRKNAFIIFLILFTAAVAFPGWSCQHARGNRSSKKIERVVKNRHHVQRMARRAHQAWNRHCNAAQPAEVETETEPEITKDTGDKTLDGSATIQK